MKKAILALLLLLPVPTIGVLFSFYVPEVGKIVWGIAKIWILLFPAVWYFCIEKGKWSWSPTTTKGFLVGILWSIPVGVAIVATYHFWGQTLIDATAREKIDELGIASPYMFILFAVAMSLGNSLMEEYVWRWFVFSKFKTLVGAWPAIILSSLFFTAHHVVILWNFGSVGLVLVGSSGLCAGGIIWAWLYNKYNSVWPGWISHVIADAVIMVVAWQIITG